MRLASLACPAPQGTQETLKIGFGIPVWATPRLEFDNDKQIPALRAALTGQPVVCWSAKRYM